MTDTIIASVAHVAQAASEALAPGERARAVLEALRRVVPYDCAELSSWNPAAGAHSTLASVGYDARLLAWLNGTDRVTELDQIDLRTSGQPMRLSDLPAHGLAARTVREFLLPAGFLAEAAYSFLDAVNDRPGALQSQQLSYRPPNRLFLRLARRGDRVEGYAEASFTSRMPRNQYGSAFLPAQLTVNAGAGARAFGPLWLDVEVKNFLADETLEDVFQYPLPGLSIAVIARAQL